MCRSLPRPYGHALLEPDPFPFPEVRDRLCGADLRHTSSVCPVTRHLRQYGLPSVSLSLLNM